MAVGALNDALKALELSGFRSRSHLAGPLLRVCLSSCPIKRLPMPMRWKSGCTQTSCASPTHCDFQNAACAGTASALSLLDWHQVLECSPSSSASGKNQAYEADLRWLIIWNEALRIAHADEGCKYAVADSPA